MADIVNTRKRSEMMAGIRAKDTKPELVVRRLLHSLGYRFRLHCKDLPGKPDIVLPKWRTVVLVHGCFWHGHANCPLFRPPKSRTEFWTKKIRANEERDDLVRLKLSSLGWRIVEVWECAIKGRQRLEPETLANLLSDSINQDLGPIISIRGLDSVKT
ncbi:very short patch repair endonuclease [Porphyrobacter sp. AAP60]|uniref:very short patch repair endonuclease n=1 Tax=Porphyrobacter sp. AAP60 TaxID=1523423 RepID=UPI0009E8EAF9|nr:DNA mismatch endonuclease Vsr [Porphyrobacter sp. AAP60]